MNHSIANSLSRSIALALLVAVSTCSANQALATAAIQRVFVNEFIKSHPDGDYVKFVRRKAKCLMCHQGKGGHYNNRYGEEMAKLIDFEKDEKNKEKVLAAIKTVNELPLDPSDESSMTFGERIAASMLPGADDLEELKVMPEPEAVDLFDGESLAGWVGATDAYEVREGAIVCKQGTSGNLFTEKEYGDFEFSFEFKLTPGANNGIGVRAPLEGDPAFEGIEIQVLDDTADQHADLKEWQFHGSAYGVAAAKRGVLKPVGEWNSQVIRCQGRKLTVTLNEELILDVDLDEVAPDGKTLDGREHPGLARDKGHIGLLGHGSEVAFRNLQVAELHEPSEEEEE